MPNGMQNTLDQIKAIQALTSPSAKTYVQFRAADEAKAKAEVDRLTKTGQSLAAQEYRLATSTKSGGSAAYTQAMNGVIRQRNVWSKNISDQTTRRMKMVAGENDRRRDLRQMNMDQKGTLENFAGNIKAGPAEAGAIKGTADTALNGMKKSAGRNAEDQMPAIYAALNGAIERNEEIGEDKKTMVLDYINGEIRNHTGKDIGVREYYISELGNLDYGRIRDEVEKGTHITTADWKNWEAKIEALNPALRGITADTPAPTLTDPINRQQNWFGPGYQVYDNEAGQRMVRPVPDTSEEAKVVADFAGNAPELAPKTAIPAGGVPLDQAVQVVQQRSDHTTKASRQYRASLQKSIAQNDRELARAKEKHAQITPLTQGEVALMAHPLAPPGMRGAPPMRLLKRHAKMAKKVAAARAARQANIRSVTIGDVDVEAERGAPGVNVIKAFENQMESAYRDYTNAKAAENETGEFQAMGRMNAVSEAIADSPDFVTRSFLEALGEDAYATIEKGIRLPVWRGDRGLSFGEGDLFALRQNADTMGKVFDRVRNEPVLYDLGFLDNFVETATLNPDGVELSQMHLLLRSLDKEESQGAEYQEDNDSLGTAGRALLNRLDAVAPEGMEINKQMEAYESFASDPENRDELEALGAVAVNVNPVQFPIEDRWLSVGQAGTAFVPTGPQRGVKDLAVGEFEEWLKEHEPVSPDTEPPQQSFAPPTSGSGVATFSLDNLSDEQKGMVDVIRKHFYRAGFDDKMVAAALANAWAESTLDPKRSSEVKRKDGTFEPSVGLFQLNSAEPGYGGWREDSSEPMTVEERQDPDINTLRIIEVVQGPSGKALRAAYDRGADAEELTRLFTEYIERPQNREAEGQRRAKAYTPAFVNILTGLPEMQISKDGVTETHGGQVPAPEPAAAEPPVAEEPPTEAATAEEPWTANYTDEDGTEWRRRLDENDSPEWVPVPTTPGKIPDAYTLAFPEDQDFMDEEPPPAPVPTLPRLDKGMADVRDLAFDSKDAAIMGEPPTPLSDLDVLKAQMVLAGDVPSAPETPTWAQRMKGVTGRSAIDDPPEPTPIEAIAPTSILADIREDPSGSPGSAEWSINRAHDSGYTEPPSVDPQTFIQTAGNVTEKGKAAMDSLQSQLGDAAESGDKERVAVLETAFKALINEIFPHTKEARRAGRVISGAARKQREYLATGDDTLAANMLQPAEDPTSITTKTRSLKGRGIIDASGNLTPKGAGELDGLRNKVRDAIQSNDPQTAQSNFEHYKAMYSDIYPHGGGIDESERKAREATQSAIVESHRRRADQTPESTDPPTALTGVAE